jgi:hypothetical protein
VGWYPVQGVMGQSRYLKRSWIWIHGYFTLQDWAQGTGQKQSNSAEEGDQGKTLDLVPGSISRSY